MDWHLSNNGRHNRDKLWIMFMMKPIACLFCDPHVGAVYVEDWSVRSLYVQSLNGSCVSRYSSTRVCIS
ncbi:hypothetical protein [Paenibacillus sp. PCH8]|uniref:hypothetical protein n=1 Tax=Paenibacillus sp. PCH8 TaxID=2066524 RepID=UPI0015E458B1|nr:hypothetical protein [Paenibacillus sp. PCH8]